MKNKRLLFDDKNENKDLKKKENEKKENYDTRPEILSLIHWNSFLKNKIKTELL